MKDSYTQFMRGDSSDEDERIPLNDDQKQKLKDYFERLQIILENICNNLSDICKNLHDNTIHAKFKSK